MSLSIGIMPPGLDHASLAFVRDAERVGATSVWAPETWVYDAFTPLGYLAAATETMRLATGIAQLGARTPAVLAMSALALQKMSDGRFILGLGASGPQVIEAGTSACRPVTRTWKQSKSSEDQFWRTAHLRGHYATPPPDSEGRALFPAGPVDIRSTSRRSATSRLTGEMADGGSARVSSRAADTFLDFIREGATAAGRTLDDIELTVAASLEFTDDLEEAGRRHAEAMRLRSVPWDQARRTSTIRLSLVKVMPRTCPKSRGYGSRATARRPAPEFLPPSDSTPIS